MSKLSTLLARQSFKPVPKGWRTVEQIAKAENTTTNYARQLAMRCHKAGILDRQIWRIQTAGGFRKAPIYRVKK